MRDKEFAKKLRDLEAYVSKLEADNENLRAALETIYQWDLPKMADGQPYGLHYGSNGERDYMRRIAIDALNGLSQERSK